MANAAPTPWHRAAKNTNLVRNVGKSSSVEAVALWTCSRHKLVEERYRLLTWVVVVFVFYHARLQVTATEHVTILTGNASPAINTGIW